MTHPELNGSRRRVLRKIALGQSLDPRRDWVHAIELLGDGLVEGRKAGNGQLEITGATPSGKAALITLSTSMVLALTKACTPEGLGPWDFGSGTIGALKRHAFVALADSRKTRYFATDVGRAKLGGRQVKQTAIETLKAIGEGR